MNRFRTIQRQLHEAKLGNWTYKLPDDKEQRLYDFYFMTLFFGRQINDLDVRFSVEQTQKKLLPALKEDLLESVFYSICAETRHVLDLNYISGVLNTTEASFGSVVKKKMEKYFEVYAKKSHLTHFTDEMQKEIISKRLATRSRKDMIKLTDNKKDYNNSYLAARTAFRGDRKSFIEASQLYFEHLDWNNMYGGPAWASICKGWTRLYNAEKEKDLIVAIDHIYDLQHNTGSVFTKLKEYMKENSFRWLKKALDFKRDIKNPFALYDKISPHLRTMAGYALKEVYNITLETWLKERGKIGTKFSHKFKIGDIVKNKENLSQSHYGTVKDVFIDDITIEWNFSGSLHTYPAENFVLINNADEVDMEIGDMGANSAISITKRRQKEFTSVDKSIKTFQGDDGTIFIVDDFVRITKREIKFPEIHGRIYGFDKNTLTKMTMIVVIPVDIKGVKKYTLDDKFAFFDDEIESVVKDARTLERLKKSILSEENGYQRILRQIGR